MHCYDLRGYVEGMHDFISKIIGMITYLLLNFLKIIVTTQALKWLLMKLFMGEDKYLLLDGLKLVKQG